MKIFVPLTVLLGVQTLLGLIFRKRLAADWILKRQFACFSALGIISLDRCLEMNTFMENTSNKYFGNFSDEQVAHYC